MGHVNKVKVISWLKAITQGDSTREVEAKTGIGSSTIARARKNGILQMESILKIARGYGVNPIAAFLEMEFIEMSELQDFGFDSMVRQMSDQDVLRLIASRIDDDPSVWEDWTFEHLTFIEDPKKVLPAQKEEIPLTDKDGFLNPAAVAGLTLVADSSPLEPEPGDDDYGA